MKLLVASPLAYHDRCGNGGGVICWSLLEGLHAAGHRIAFVAFIQPGDDAVLARTRLATVCDEVHLVPLPVAGRAQALGRRAAQWLGGPPAEGAAFASPAFAERLSTVRQRFLPDLALLQFPYMAQYAASLAGTPVVMDVQDLFFVSRLRAWSAARGRWQRLKKMVAWLAWTRYERDNYARCALLMTLTDEDRSALHALVPGVPAFTNPAAIAPRAGPAVAAATAAAAAAVQAPQTQRVGFGGHFGHPPNADGLRWLNDQIAPELARRCPGVRIAVAGRGADALLPPAVRHPALELLGFVDDYDRFVRSCSVFVAPLRTGGGVKVKVLEALACGRPVVTTAIGAEGIALGAEDGLFVAADAPALAAQIALLLADPVLALAAGQRGAARVAREFGVEAAVRRFELEVARVLPAQHPVAEPLAAVEPTAAAPRNAMAA